MKIVTLCGSMRFKNEMKKIGYILETKYDMCVLQCVYNEDGMELGEKERITVIFHTEFKGDFFLSEAAQQP